MQAKGQAEIVRCQLLPMNELYAYLIFVATLPETVKEFAKRLLLTVDAAKEMDTDIRDIIKVYAKMRDDCGDFRDGTFRNIVQLVSSIARYAKKAQDTHPDLHDRIRTIRKTENIDERTDNIQTIKFLVQAELQKLRKEIKESETCDVGISKFHGHIQSHERQIEDERRVQDKRLVDEEPGGTSRTLTNHVEVIQRKMEEITKLRAMLEDEPRAGTLNQSLGVRTQEETIWVHFVGVVPKSVFEYESCEVSRQQIQNAVKHENPATASERLWLYRALILRSLDEIHGRIQSVSNAVGVFRGVFENFKSCMKGVEESVEYLDDAEMVPDLYIQGYKKDLGMLADAAKSFTDEVYTVT